MNLHNVRLTKTEIQDIMEGLQYFILENKRNLTDKQSAIGPSEIKGLEGRVKEADKLLSRLDTIYG